MGGGKGLLGGAGGGGGGAMLWAASTEEFSAREFGVSVERVREEVRRDSGWVREDSEVQAWAEGVITRWKGLTCDRFESVDDDYSEQAWHERLEAIAGEGSVKLREWCEGDGGRYSCGVFARWLMGEGLRNELGLYMHEALGQDWNMAVHRWEVKERRIRGLMRVGSILEVSRITGGLNEWAAQVLKHKWELRYWGLSS